MHEISLLLGTWATSDLDLRETKTVSFNAFGGH